jgi:hypothetical protein
MPLTFNQFLKAIAARRPAPRRDDRDDRDSAETPRTESQFQALADERNAAIAAHDRRARRRRSSRFCEEDRGEPERLLTPAEIQRMLWFYSSEAVRSQRRVLITAIADWSNLHRDTVYEARRGCPANNGRMSERVRTVLSRTITEIEKKGMSFKRSGMQWEVFENPPLPYTPPAAALQPSPADLKVIPRDLGNGLIINVAHGW